MTQPLSNIFFNLTNLLSQRIFIPSIPIPHNLPLDLFSPAQPQHLSWSSVEPSEAASHSRLHPTNLMTRIITTPKQPSQPHVTHIRPLPTCHLPPKVKRDFTLLPPKYSSPTPSFPFIPRKPHSLQHSHHSPTPSFIFIPLTRFPHYLHPSCRTSPSPSRPHTSAPSPSQSHPANISLHSLTHSSPLPSPPSQTSLLRPGPSTPSFTNLTVTST